MAYGVKYRLEFTDIQQDEWKVDILEDDYAEAISAMIPSGTPLTIEWLTAGDDLTLGPVKGSMATINVECTTNFEYISLYDEEDLVRPVNVYNNEVLYWTGWLSNEYTEPYDSVPYTVSITAADGLGILKNIPYKNAGADYTGRVTADSIIKIILGHLGHEDYIEYCNVYEDRMSDGTTDSLFDQEYIDNDVFLDADCYSALSAILSKLNAVIRQWGGKFIIYRPAELINTTVYGRSMVTGAVAGVTLSPDKVLDRDAMDLIDFNGGVLMLQAPMTKFTATQNYGSRESWIKNNNFDIDTWQGYLAGNARFTHWLNSSPVAPISEYGPTSRELQGVYLAGGGAIGQSFATYAKTCTDEMIMSFDYLLVNLTGSVVATHDIEIQIYDDTSTYWLTNTATPQTATWSTTAFRVLKVTATGIPVGAGSWNTATFRFSGLPIDGPYNIILFGSTVTGVDVAFKGVNFIATSDKIVFNTRRKVRWSWYAIYPRNMYKAASPDPAPTYIDVEEVTERVYEVDNTLQGIEGSQDYILGDCENTEIVNVPEQFKGALSLYVTGSLVQTATDFVIDYSADYAALSNPGVLLTSVGDTLYFESDAPGVNFTGATTITNATGSLWGTRYEVAANNAGTKQKETLTFTAGSTGEFVIISFIASGTGTWDTDMETTLDNFASDYAAAFALGNVALTNTATTLIFEEINAAGGFLCPLFKSGGSDFAATWATTTPGQVASVAPVARIDKIVLLGTSGTATVVCHAEANTATFNTDTVLDYTASWHIRDAVTGKPIIELTADEIGAMYRKGRHFIQMSMYELTESLDITKNLQDPLNKVGVSTRVFAFNRGSLDCQAREWTADFIEIGDK